MSIGTTIKKLRRERNITQEQLAEFLGVSTNAVSQWECEKTAPDIFHLPILAGIFEVSADVLLEIDLGKSKKQAELKDFTEKYADLHSQGKTAERLRLCRAMQKKYPNDETVRFYLMRALQNEDIDGNFNEIVMLGEQLLSSENMENRMGAIRGLCFSYLHKGDRSKALQYADMMPLAEDLHLHVLEGEALVEHCQNYFWKVCNRMFLYMKYLHDCKESGYTPEEKHSMLRTMLDIYHMIFSENDFGFWHERLAKLLFFMAIESARSGQRERSLDELKQMLTHIESYNEVTAISHSSLLVNRVKADQNSITKHSKETLANSSLRYFINKENDGVFDAIKNDSRYVSIKQRLAALSDSLVE